MEVILTSADGIEERCIENYDSISLLYLLYISFDRNSGILKDQQRPSKKFVLIEAPTEQA